jgi:hypothetical protein
MWQPDGLPCLANIGCASSPPGGGNKVEKWIWLLPPSTANIPRAPSVLAALFFLCHLLSYISRLLVWTQYLYMICGSLRSGYEVFYLTGYNAVQANSARYLLHTGVLLPPWRWRRYVPPKRRLTLNGLHEVISQKMVLSKLRIGPDISFGIKNREFIKISYTILTYNVIILFSR